MRVSGIRLRFLAGLVDAGTVVGGITAGVGLVVVGFVGRSRLRGRAASPQASGDGDVRRGEALDACDADQRDRPQPGRREAAKESRFPRVVDTVATVLPSLQLRAAVWGASTGLAVASRNRRGPGYRLFDLRRVDARTGGGVTVRSALVGVLFDQMRQGLTRPVIASRLRRRDERLQLIWPQLEALEREHAGDPEAVLQARMKFYEANDVGPFAGCGWSVSALLVSQLLLSLVNRDGRTVRDRVTGTLVIADH